MDSCDKLFFEVTANDCEKSFKVLFDTFYPSLCIYAKRFVEDFEIREDIVQSVFVSIWENRRTIFINSSVKSYLVSCVRNGCLNYLRRSKVFVDSENAEIGRTPLYADSCDSLYMVSELTELLKEAIIKLPESYQKVFFMSRIDGRSNKEVAVELGISEKSVERYKIKISDYLKDELRDYIPLILFFLGSKII